MRKEGKNQICDSLMDFGSEGTLYGEVVGL